jgi:hypothetical protein
LSGRVELSRGAFLRRNAGAVAVAAGMYAVEPRRARPAKHDGSNVVHRSEPGGQKVLYAGTGTERNGVFFV